MPRCVLKLTSACRQWHSSFLLKIDAYERIARYKEIGSGQRNGVRGVRKSYTAKARTGARKSRVADNCRGIVNPVQRAKRDRKGIGSTNKPPWVDFDKVRTHVNHGAYQKAARNRKKWASVYTLTL